MYRKNKYGNRKTIIDDIKFDSKKEGLYYLYLKSRLLKNEFEKMELQPKIELQPKFKYQNKTIRAISYVADFLIYHNDGTLEYIDVKGMQTALFKLKWKMVKNKFKDDNKVTLTIV